MKKINLPFLGTDSHHFSFEYLLLKLTTRSALISIPPWVVKRTSYAKREQLNLHLHGFSIKPYEQSSLTGEGIKVPSSYSLLGEL